MDPTLAMTAVGPWRSYAFCPVLGLKRTREARPCPCQSEELENRPTSCVRCDDTGWVCEALDDRPWDSGATSRPCKCGAPGTARKCTASSIFHDVVKIHPGTVIAVYLPR